VSFSLIAEKLTLETKGPALSRSACMGRAHRLKLPGRLAGSQPKHSRKRAHSSRQVNVPVATKPSRSDKAKQLHAEYTERPTDELCEGFRHISLLELTAQTCKWPLGEGPSYVFCGQQPHDEFPYCKFHGRIAYLPAHERGGNVKAKHTTTGQFS
jgi:GcrA cell cycle regulator